MKNKIISDETYARIAHLTWNELAHEYEKLEANNERGANVVIDLINTMKQPAIRGAKTVLQMCKFLDVWIVDLEDALSYLQKETP